MAAPTIATFTLNVGNMASATSASVAKPTGVAVGDLLLIVVGNDSPSATPQWNNTTNKPSGFEFINTAGGSLSDAHVAMFWRIADGTEGSTFSTTCANATITSGWLICLRITGADPTAPMNAVGSDVETNDSINPTTVTQCTTTVADCLGVFGLSHDGAAYTSFSVGGTGWFNAGEFPSETASPSPNGTGALLGIKVLGAAGGSGDATVSATGTQDGMGAFQIAIAPVQPRPVGRKRRHARNDVDPNEFRGRTRRGRPADLASDFYQPTFLRYTRRALPPDPPPNVVRGRTKRGRPADLASDFYQGFPIRFRRIPPPRPDPSVLRGRTRRSPLPSPGAERVPPRRKNHPPVPDFSLLRGRTRRRWMPVYLVFERAIALRFDIDVQQVEALTVIARNLVDGTETVLGTATLDALTISSVAIPDGEYSLRVEGAGRFWPGARYAQEWHVTIVGGELVLPLPSLTNVRATQREADVAITWTLDEQAGTSTPADFGLWISSSSPVDTSGAPDQVVAFAGVGGYLEAIAESSSTFYVAVAARSAAAAVGPVSEITVAPAEDDPEEPPNQSARIPDGDWT